MLMNQILLAIFWIIYCMLHSVLASTTFKRVMKEKMKQYFKYYRPVYVLFSFVSLIAIIYFQISIGDTQLFSQTTIILVFGIVLGLFGVAIMIACIQKYFLHLSGLRSLFQERTTSSLMVSGIHRYVRHPLYLGTFIFIWSLLLLLPYAGLLISNIVITLYTLIGIRLEEQKLIEEYGDEYRIYKKQVPKLFPYYKARLP